VSGQSSEEKTLPASARKIAEERRKGRVSHSRDLVDAAVLLTAFAYLLWAWPSIGEEMRRLVDALGDLVVRPFPEARDRGLALAEAALLWFITPLLALVSVAGILAGMAGTRGPVLSFTQLTPKPENLNPVQGLKRIVSLRNLVELAKSVGKIAILLAVFAAVLPAWLQPLFEIPACGADCLVPMLVAVLKPLMAAAALVFGALGVVDAVVQYRLFLRDMRMTKTEQKRERKDSEGDPMVRGRRRQLFAELLAQAESFGIGRAVIAVVDGDRVVGLRYVQGETPLPMVVAKARGVAGIRMAERACRDGIPIVQDAELVAALAARHALGKYVERDLFRPVAMVLVRAGIL
jgi:type III secretion protein U